MERFMYALVFIIRYILPPIVGGLIGLFTNWLALQMLFHPYKAVYIGKFRLPFTPGIIPKRKESVARAIGKAVAEEVLTEKELGMIFASPAIKEKCISAVKDFIYQNKTIGSLAQNLPLDIPLEKTVSQKVTEKLIEADMEEIIVSCLVSVLKNKPVLSFLLTEKLLAPISIELSVSIKKYLQQNGAEIIEKLLHTEVENKRVGDILTTVGLTPEKTEEKLSAFYDTFTSNGLKEILMRADVAAVVEQKINAMDVKEIADLTFKVMKREMRAIVYLGGLLGGIIGVVNIFV